MCTDATAGHPSASRLPRKRRSRAHAHARHLQFCVARVSEDAIFPPAVFAPFALLLAQALEGAPALFFAGVLVRASRPLMTFALGERYAETLMQWRVTYCA